jgi:hypothetical protein
MKLSKWLALFGLCLIAFLAIGIDAPDAYAQDNNSIKANDKNSAEKFGVADSLASSDDEDDSDGPSKLQMGLGLGSCAVSYIVLKFL